MIKLEGITKSFGSLQVLKGIDLEINKGEIVSIVGPSGAGKTTLLQIMGTLDEPDAGNVQIDGTVVSRMKEKELSAFRNKNIGFVFQFHQLLPEFTALENIMIPAFIALLIILSLILAQIAADSFFICSTSLKVSSKSS
jgi:lipoprotein-releasing system ATP-binding protein